MRHTLWKTYDSPKRLPSLSYCLQIWVNFVNNPLWICYILLCLLRKPNWCSGVNFSSSIYSIFDIDFLNYRRHWQQATDLYDVTSAAFFLCFRTPSYYLSNLLETRQVWRFENCIHTRMYTFNTFFINRR